MTLSSLSVAAAGAAAVLLTGAAPAVAQAKEFPVIVELFAADSGDRCRLKPDRGPMGATKGVLGWHVSIIGNEPIVDVKGSVFDQPLPDDTGRACSDGLFTSATFTALSGKTRVDTEIRRVDDGQADFSFRLTGTTQITMVVIQVCRHPLGIGISYCGPAQQFPTPVA